MPGVKFQYLPWVTWNKLILQLVEESSTPTEEVDVVIQDLVEMTKELNLNLEEEDFVSLINKKEELIEEPKQFETAKMGEYLNMIRDGLAGLETQDPDPERSAKVTEAVNNDIPCYTLIYEERKRTKRQLTLD
ncbi:Tigger transposable element-derived protein 1 [Anthophora plagiata]